MKHVESEDNSKDVNDTAIKQTIYLTKYIKDLRFITVGDII